MCDPPYEGIFLPLLGDDERKWPNGLRLVLYVLGLGWTFLGIAVISDVFMAAIEKITSSKKRVVNKETGRSITVTVWNPTVANLTLMALGSSAPEILLSVIEILTNDMFIGDLGAGTIVGSAAFNLLIISAVCICALPDGEVRYIKEMPVYAITASFSVFAYVWMMFIVVVFSPNKVEIWEGILTFLFFPILVVLAFLADKGYFSKTNSSEERKVLRRCLSDDFTKDEIAQVAQEIREEHGSNLTDDQVMKLIEAQYFGHHSRAYYRHAAMAKGIGGGKKNVEVHAGPPDLTVMAVTSTGDDVDKEAEERTVKVGFAASRYAFLENCVKAKIKVLRMGPLQGTVTVKYKTRDGNAQAGSDYVAQEGVLEFKPEETEKVIIVDIIDDNAYEEDEEFYIDLSDPVCEDSPHPIRLSSTSSVTVLIVDDDEPGSLRFQGGESMDVEEATEDRVITIVVERYSGASGTIGCRYHTEDHTAVAGYDYEATKGELVLEERVQTAMINVTIKAKGRYDNMQSFNVYLTKPTNGAKFDKDTDGGTDCCILHVQIKPNEAHKNVIDGLASRVNWNMMKLGHSNWKSQFRDAIFMSSEEDDEEDDGEVKDGEDDGPSKFDYFMHILSLPWKIIFAFVPPVDFCGGWPCFCCSLLMIAFVTAIVGDMANLVGCSLGILPEITAITFVALGTSLPDTFASKTAAIMDPYADASIGNVTGSNSVNVFLGLGMPWTMAAIYWAAAGQTEQWKAKFAPDGPYYSVRSVLEGHTGDGAFFVVPGGSLWFNLMVFSANAFFAIQHLCARRRKVGGELGGHKKAQYISAAFLVCQWFLYVGLSSMWATIQDE
mmetsp:Transcript_60819/g.131959  ORF Transcript_60819/g.131959 Transcript_60819/m.131959 type:complete len:834 (-) Transcript_60819:296-2797(-)